MTMVFWDYPKLPVAFLNDEHQTFISLMNDAEQALTLGNFSEQHFKRLVQHCQEHFAHEEREMQVTEFPDFTAHKKQHDSVLERMFGLLEEYQLNRDITPLLEYVQDDLPDWFGQHIVTLDKAMAQHLLGATKRARKVKSPG